MEKIVSVDWKNFYKVFSLEIFNGFTVIFIEFDINEKLIYFRNSIHTVKQIIQTNQAQTDVFKPYFC